jgi:hypothetical protein
MDIEHYRRRVRNALDTEMPGWAWKTCLLITLGFLLFMVGWLAVTDPLSLLWSALFFGGIYALARFLSWLMA